MGNMKADQLAKQARNNSNLQEVYNPCDEAVVHEDVEETAPESEL